MKRFYTAFSSTLLTVALAGSAIAQPSTSASSSGEFNLQGRLTTTSGTALTNGTHAVQINIYANGSGSAMYTETDNVTTNDGIFSTIVGDNGSGSLTLNANTNYEIGISVDGQAELLPHITIGSAPKAIVANVANMADSASVAINANAVGGFKVGTGNQANSLVVLNSQGMLDSNIIGSNIVRSINGMTGNVNFRGNGNLSLNTSGDTVIFNVTGGSGGGSGLTFPYTQTLNLGSGDAFSISNTLGGSAAAFSNIGTGNALRLSSLGGSALNATSTGGLGSSPTINVSNTSGSALTAVSTGASAINATASSAGNAALTLKNTSGSTTARLLSALDASGNTILDLSSNGLAITTSGQNSSDAVLHLQNSTANGNLINALDNTGSSVLNVASNGATTIQSSAATALSVTSSATGGTAAKLTGGLTLVGPIGTATIPAGSLTATITNPYVKANSIILLTVNSGLSAAVPIRLSSQSNGSFSASLISAGTLLGDLSFNYLIINQ